MRGLGFTVTETATGHQAAKSNENTMAAVAYILTWVTGLIMLLTAPKTAKFQRWHAIQAIGLGIAFTAIYIVWSIIIVGIVLSGATPGTAALFGLVQLILYLGLIAAIVILAVNAYQGKKIRLPIIADIADKNA